MAALSDEVPGGPGVPLLAPRRWAKYSLSLAYFGGLLKGT